MEHDHTSDFLIPLAQVFGMAGHAAKFLGLPSVGASPPVLDFSDDVAAVRNIAFQLIAQRKDIIAVLHSLGGIPGSEALHGLGKLSTGGAGVISIVYIASMIPEKGKCFDDHVKALGDDTWKPTRRLFTEVSSWPVA